MDRYEESGVDGELMWPERFGPREVDNLKAALGPYLASGRLQQMPVPKGGGIIQRDWWLCWGEERRYRMGAGLEYRGGRAKAVAGDELGRRIVIIRVQGEGRKRLERFDDLGSVDGQGQEPARDADVCVAEADLAACESLSSVLPAYSETLTR